MNRTLAILLLLLSVLFTACQSDEPAIDDGGGKTDGMNIGYIAVNIVQPTSAGARSRTGTTEPTVPTTGFEYGSDDENMAEKALFFLFKEKTNNSTPVYEVNGKPFVEINVNGSGIGTSPEVERIYNTVLVIDGVDTDPTQEVKSIVCVLNAPDALKSTEDTKKIKTLEQLNQLIGEYGSSTAGTFIMTNSVYTSDGNITTPTSKTVNDSNGNDKQESLVKKSAAEAQQDPVDIYVERVVAKVEASFKSGDNEFKNEGAKPTIDGVETLLGITITGIEVANIASKSYLFKSVSGASAATSGIWKDEKVFDTTNKRSYWETVPEIGTGDNKMELNNMSYKDIVTKSASSTPSTTEEGETTGDGEDSEESTSLASIVDTYKGDNKFRTYIQPNTLEEVTNQPTNRTCILVTAQLTKNNQPITDLTYIRGGYTTQTKALNVVAAYLATKEYYKKIEETGQSARFEQLSADDLEWKNKYSFGESSQERSQLSWLKDYEVVAQIKSSVSKLYTIIGEEIENGVDNANKHLRAATSGDAIAKNYCARVFTDGKCYYFKEIDHSSVLEKAVGTYYGVVRNHIYRLTLESIKGIGTPVFDPEDLIIPQKPNNETTFYLGARVNVLAWKLATQNVNFGGN